MYRENLPGNKLDFCYYSGEMIIQSAQLAYYLNFELAKGNDIQKENIINTPPGVQDTTCCSQTSRVLNSNDDYTHGVSWGEL